MSIKKSLIGLAATALMLMGFASSAMAATDGVIRDVSGTNPIIANGTTLHLVGWSEFVNEAGDGIVCHSTSNLTTTNAQGTTGHATFSVPNTTFCKGTGALAQCTVTSVTTANGPYHVTVTPTDFDITGTIVINNTLDGFLCPASIQLTFSSITVKPLNTTNKHTATGTSGNLGNTAAAGDPIAGGELSGTGESHSILGTEQITASGELEVQGTNRCTYKIQAS